MKEKPNMTSLRTSENIIRYDINGYIYEFVVKDLCNGVPYGHCYKIHKWALLYPDHIVTGDGYTVYGKRI